MHLAEAIAVLHDIGRFEQFFRYHTYSDSASVDHARLGADIIERTGIVKMLAADERCGVTQRFQASAGRLGV